MTWRQAYPHPVGRDIAFGLSFIIFWFASERLQGNKSILYVWTLVQALLGVWVIRGRKRARQKVLRCIRCNSRVPEPRSAPEDTHFVK